MDLVRNLEIIKAELPEDVSLVAVSKTKPSSMIQLLYDAGQLDFGENKVQDLVAKYETLPGDIRWHMIGHLQSNKVKYIAPFVYLIHAVDSMKLLSTIEKEGQKNNRRISCLFQLHIAEEDSKFGMDLQDLEAILGSKEYQSMNHVQIRGLMGMATFTEDSIQVRNEFQNLKRIFEFLKKKYFSLNDDFSILSMGMSGDYKLALEEGSNMIRVGSSIFGPRNYT